MSLCVPCLTDTCSRLDCYCVVCVQTLIDDGTLTVVQYNDMPKHESSLYQPTHVDNYLMQARNHRHPYRHMHVAKQCPTHACVHR